MENIKTNGAADSQLLHFPDTKIVNGKPKVYFCCVDNRINDLFDHTTSLVLEACPDAVIFFHNANGAENRGEYLQCLEAMQVFVVAVTKEVLEEEAGITEEIQFAIERNIPVLPLMDQGLSCAEFGRMYPGIHCLSEYETDMTAIPFREKIKSFFDGIFLNEAIFKQIEKEFDNHIFISYRKKDREHAQRVMKAIHDIEKYRDTAIWYDEFLVPGEDYNEAIIDAIKKSIAFVLVATPNILEEGNYVLQHEYPDAIEFDANRISIEALPTDHGKLEEVLKEMPEVALVDDGHCIEEVLSKYIAAREDKANDPRHLFYIGLAYFMGVHVEKNPDKGWELIERAANEGVDEAFEYIVGRYASDKKTLYKAYEWQQKYLDLMFRREKQAETADLAFLVKLAEEVLRTGDICFDYYMMVKKVPVMTVGDQNMEEQQQKHQALMQNWLESCRKYLNYVPNVMLQQLNQMNHKECMRLFAMGAQKMALSYVEEGDAKASFRYFQNEAMALQEILRMEDTDETRAKLAYCEFQWGNACETGWNMAAFAKSDNRDDNDIVMAIDHYEKALAIYTQLMKADDGIHIKRPKIRLNTNIIYAYKKLGKIPDNCREMLEEALGLSETLYLQTKLEADYRQLADICFLMAEMTWLTKEERLAYAERNKAILEEVMKTNKDIFPQLLHGYAVDQIERLKKLGS